MFVKNKEVSSVLWNTVHFSDGSTREITKHQHYIITEEALDESAYRELIISTVLPLLQDSIKTDDEKEAWKSIIEVMEQHDLTQTEIWTILDRLKQSLVTTYNNLFKERIWKEYDKYIEDSKKYEKVSNHVSRSLSNAVMNITWQLFWTYNADMPEDSYIGEIKTSDVLKAAELLKKLKNI